MTKPNLVPIIQTQGMKAKEKLSKEALATELAELNAIDKLTSDEIADGDEICNDGVQLSVQGSDFEDDFPEEGTENTASQGDNTDTVPSAPLVPLNMIEPGEVVSSDGNSDGEMDDLRHELN